MASKTTAPPTISAIFFQFFIVPQSGNSFQTHLSAACYGPRRSKVPDGQWPKSAEVHASNYALAQNRGRAKALFGCSDYSRSTALVATRNLQKKPNSRGTL